jgi:cytochrome c peroxidase
MLTRYFRFYDEPNPTIDILDRHHSRSEKGSGLCCSGSGQGPFRRAVSPKRLTGARLCFLLALASGILPLPAPAFSKGSDYAVPEDIDAQLVAILTKLQFTGKMESTLEQKLGRKIDQKLVKVGQMLWFDTVTGLHDDNTCAGCHAPAFGFGDSQSIAIGVQSNLIIGPGRDGPYNQRRSPKALNIAFYPALMWNGRFNAPSGDPFDNSQGFLFPAPEGALRFPPHMTPLSSTWPKPRPICRRRN